MESFHAGNITIRFERGIGAVTSDACIAYEDAQGLLTILRHADLQLPGVIEALEWALEAEAEPDPPNRVYGHTEDGEPVEINDGALLRGAEFIDRKEGDDVA